MKADSEHRPGPFAYGRDHADGANMLAEALEPHGGLVIWRASYTTACRIGAIAAQTERGRPMIILPRWTAGLRTMSAQIKNGPMDFQVREPVSPLFGGMKETNQVLEFQVAQEYTGGGVTYAIWCRSGKRYWISIPMRMGRGPR